MKELFGLWGKYVTKNGKIVKEYIGPMYKSEMIDYYCEYRHMFKETKTVHPEEVCD